MNVTVIIPSLNPDEKLLCVVDSLIAAGFEDIVLVNDGSDEAHMAPFKRIAEYNQCTILNHEVNRGKGRALKTAFEYICVNRPNIAGVVTVDGDNQHQAKDIISCCKAMLEYKDKLVLGVRDFSLEHVPAKSSFGNNMTRAVFRVLCGLNISDTQTGLRAIPARWLRTFIDIAGERFEYETNMLLALKKNNIGYVEVPIETVYIEENASTHFNPIVDSIKIYMVIFKFMFGSLSACGIDMLIFAIVSWLLAGRTEVSVRIFAATVIARVISSIYNYSFNKLAVFKNEGSIRQTIIRYYILCVCQMCVSYLLVNGLTLLFSAGVFMSMVIKLAVDVALFFISFQIQKRWVYR